MTLESPSFADGQTRPGFYRDPEKIVVQGLSKVGFPARLYDDLVATGVNPNERVVEVIKLGILADRGMLAQPIGGEELTVTVADSTPYQVETVKSIVDETRRIPSTKPTLNLSIDTVKLIAQTSQIFGDHVTDERMSRWFLCALQLWEFYEGADLLHFRTSPTETRDLTAGNVKDLWEKLGLPTTHIEVHGTGIAGFATLTLKKPAKSAEAQTTIQPSPTS